MVAQEGFRAPIADLVDALVRGDFDLLDQDGRSGSVGAEGLRRSITLELATLPAQGGHRLEVTGLHVL